MSFAELACVFPCGETELVGVLALPHEPTGSVGVLVIVGGPQYRVGSHRQFLQLSRRLAAAGVPVMRFDYRGMGDAGGETIDFEHTGPDIEAATEAFMRAAPSVRHLVLWGLCDGASAAAMYLPQDSRIAGVALLNPWVRTLASQERAEVTHYYARRFRDPAFWRKLVRGGVAVGPAIADFAAKAWRMMKSRTSPLEQTALSAAAPADFRERMSVALAAFQGRSLVMLSGRDLVAAEFRDYLRQTSLLRAWSEDPRTTMLDFPQADHTFSSRAQKRAVEDAMLSWLADLEETLC